VGAGPGDPDLITIKALNILRRADVVLYDRLVDPTLLLETRSGCILVDVGKDSGHHTKTQDEIVELLVEYGSKGLEVVRLKGGDPFLFGRGGEEAEKLFEAKIPFMVIPGVSALLGATAYAGIPVTHRDFSSSVGIATGHVAKEKDHDPVKWRLLAQSVDTIVVFMGVGTIQAITDELMTGGLSPDTPAAVIEHGTTPLQRVVTGNLGCIADISDKERISPPALLVIGNTVALQKQLNWYNPGHLAGLRIGVTRPFDQSKVFTGTLRSLGATPILMPTIKTVVTIDKTEVRNCIDSIASYDYLIFSSTNGVHSFFQALRQHGSDSRVLFGKVVAAIGPVTGETLTGYGITADLTVKTFIAESLLDKILSAGRVSGKKMLLVRSDIGRNVLPEGLKAAGAIVEDVSFYSTQTADLSQYVINMIHDGKIDIITFTSSSTVKGFFSQITPDRVVKIKLASIGPETSKAIRHYSRNPDIEAEEYTTDGLVRALCSYYGKGRTDS